MQNLPGVTVQDNKVQLRGNDKVTILTDGKQTAMAIKEFYNHNYDKSSSLLLRSRSMFTNLNNLSSWVSIENVLLNILNCVYTNDFKLMESEIGLFKRLIRKFHYVKEFGNHFNGLFRSIRQYQSGNANINEIIHQMSLLKTTLNVFRLVPLGEEEPNTVNASLASAHRK